MSKLRWTLRVYVVATIAAGLLTTLLAGFADRRTATDTSLLVFGLLLGVTTAAKTRPVHVSLKMKMTVDDAPVFAAALLLGPFMAMLIAGGGTLVGLRFGGKMPLYNRLFNTASSALSAGAAASTYVALAKAQTAIGDNVGAVLVAALVGYVVQTGLVDLAVALQLRRSIIGNWWRVHRSDLAPQAALYGIGAISALAATSQPWVLLLVLVPMGIVMVALREWTKMRARTRAALVQLADLIDQRDRYTFGHSQRVAEYANRVATRMRLAPSQIELITEAARLHDVGKISTPDEVLQKPGALSPDEWEVMHRHSEAGYQLLQQLSDFWEGAELVRAHHERPDGRGYPRGASGLELPIEASVISVCDAYDAMTSDRVYRGALSPARVRAELAAGRGTQWHARVVDTLLALLDEERAATRTRPLQPLSTTPDLTA
jgi:HD-GYP domain-containing protein (c-di-GMP phosphodiesterase class II)